MEVVEATVERAPDEAPEAVREVLVAEDLSLDELWDLEAAKFEEMAAAAGLTGREFYSVLMGS